MEVGIDGGASLEDAAGEAVAFKLCSSCSDINVIICFARRRHKSISRCKTASINRITMADDFRVHNIWDAIDAGAYKQALQLAQKQLKKQPNSAIFQALAALATFKMGKVDESLKIVDKLRSHSALDTAILPILSQIYQKAGRSAFFFSEKPSPKLGCRSSVVASNRTRNYQNVRGCIFSIAKERRACQLVVC